MSVAGAPVKDPADAVSALRAAKSPVRIRIEREGRGMFLMRSARS